jgi:hypothetical protein
MTRYRYLDMPEGWTDIAWWDVEVTCVTCGRKFTICQESAWKDARGNWVADCMCSELPDEVEVPVPGSDFYDPDCPACLQGIPHTRVDHDKEIDKVWLASLAEIDEYYEPFWCREA